MWYGLPGRFLQISVGSKDLIYGVTLDKILVKWNPAVEDWETVPIDIVEGETTVSGTMTAAVGGDGQLMRSDERLRTFRFNATTSKWEKINVQLKRIHGGSRNTMVGSDNFGNWHGVWAAGNSEQTSGQINESTCCVAVGIDGTTLSLDKADGALWRCHGLTGCYPKAQKFPMAKTYVGSESVEINFKSCDVGGVNAIVAVGTDSKVYRWINEDWSPLEGSGFVYASVSYDGVVVALDSSGQALSNGFALNPSKPLPNAGSYRPDAPVVQSPVYQSTPYEPSPYQSSPAPAYQASPTSPIPSASPYQQTAYQPQPIARPGPAQAQNLPPGWISQFDPSSQRNFYVYTATGQTQWEYPQPYGAAPARYPQQYSAAPARYPQPYPQPAYPQQYAPGPAAVQQAAPMSSETALVAGALGGFLVGEVVEERLHRWW